MRNTAVSSGDVATKFIKETATAEEKPLVLMPQSRINTAMLPPVLSKIVDTDPMQSLTFTEDVIILSSKSGEYDEASLLPR